MAEITDQGFNLKTQNEYFDEEKQLYIDIDPNWNLDPSTPDGLKLAHDAEVFSNLDEVALKAYNSKDPNKSRGVDLDVISSLTGTFRSLGTPSSVDVLLSGVSGTVIVSGKLIESVIDGTQWAISGNQTIGIGGTVSATAIATVNGATQASVGTITKIIDVIPGWQSASNTAVATTGTDVQSDASLRIERRLSVGSPGNNQVDSMLGGIFNVDGVRRAVVYENDTDATDSNGLPEHSIAPIVDGGTNTDIALAIFRKKNPGTKLHAAGASVVVPDVFDLYPSNKKDITFSRPIYIDMIVTVTVQNDGSLPGNAEDLITQAILDYANGSLVASECGFNVLGFDIGEDVPISRIYTPVNQVIGRFGNSYISGLTLNGNTVNVVLAFNELSRWSESNITVSIV